MTVSHHDLRDELPTSRADLDPLREKTTFHIEGSVIGIFKGKMHVTSDSRARSPASVALVVLLLTGASCLGAAVIGFAEWLLKVPAMARGCFVLIAFLAAYAIGIFLAFFRNGDSQPLDGGSEHPPVVIRVQPEDALAHEIGLQAGVNGARARAEASREARER